MKITHIFLSAFAILVIITSCKKDNDDENWTKSMLYGTWEQTGGDDFKDCPDGDNTMMIISENDISFNWGDAETGCASSFWTSSNYNFDGKIIETMLSTSYEIVELNSTNMTLKAKFASLDAGTYIFVKK